MHVKGETVYLQHKYGGQVVETHTLADPLTQGLGDEGEWRRRVEKKKWREIEEKKG